MTRQQLRVLSVGPVFWLVLAAAGAGAQDFETYGSSVEANFQLATPIREMSKVGRHFEALAKIDELGASGLTLEDKLAAAKSSWALGLVEEARAYWDDVLGNKNLKGVERSRELLARAILELQEKNYERARKVAEEGASSLERSELRAQFWMVIGESLRAGENYAQAEAYYLKASEEAGIDGKSEALFLLAECQLKLGRVNDARYNLTAVETASRFAPAALRRLAEIDLNQRNFEGVLTWIAEGHASHAAEFEEAWVSYAEITSFVELGRLADARQALEHMRSRHSDKNTWFALAEAALEVKTAGAFLTQAKPAVLLQTAKAETLP